MGAVEKRVVRPKRQTRREPGPRKKKIKGRSAGAFEGGVHVQLNGIRAWGGAVPWSMAGTARFSSKCVHGGVNERALSGFAKALGGVFRRGLFSTFGFLYGFRGRFSRGILQHSRVLPRLQETFFAGDSTARSGFANALGGISKGILQHFRVLPRL